MYLKGDIPCQVELQNRNLNLMANTDLYLAIDLETTGLDPQNGAEVIELYWKLCDKDGNIKEENHHLFFSENSQDTFFIHGITEEELQGKGKFNSENEELIRFIILLRYCAVGGIVSLMAQYSIFEISFIEKYLGITFDENSLIYDTKFVELKLHPENPNKLKDLVEYYSLELNSELHRSKVDVDIMFKVAQEQFKLLDFI